MDNHLYIAGALTVVAGILGFYVYKQMGCTNSVQPSNNAEQSKNHSKEKTVKDAAKYPGGKLIIFFGSQTGTAEGFARTLMEEGKAAGFDAKSVDLEDFDPEVLANTKLAIFLMATYGEGEPTDNAAKFFKWLKNEDESVSADFLANMQFTVFGLGNRQYEHYNRMGKLVNKFLEERGAKRVFSYGEGDDDGTLEEDFDAWKSTIWTSLRQQFHLESSSGASSASQDHNNELSLKPISKQFSLKSYGHEMPSKRARSNTMKIQNSTRHFFNPRFAPLITKKELRNQQFIHQNGNGNGVVDEIGSTLHLEFHLGNTGITYMTADNLAILPENSSERVIALAQQLKYDLDEIIDIEPSTGEDGEEQDDDFKLTYPTPCSVRDLLTYYVDIQGKLSHATLKHLLAYVRDDRQRAWLADLLADRPKYHKEIEDNHRHFVDLISQELSSIDLPLVDFLHLMSPIQARDYTISSSSSLSPDIVHITVSVTEYQTKNGSRFNGLCSAYLKSLTAQQSRCRIYVKESTFRLPKTLSSPVIMIGPGTGLAPMRALLQERQYLLQQQQQSGSSAKSLGPALLFFGCKHEKMDFIYSDELKAHQQTGALTELFTAFSRDSAKKVYVQHLLTETSTARQLMHYLLEENAHVYVCGATLMGNDVMNTFISLIASYKQCSHDDATAILKRLQEKKPNAPARYVQELWS